MPINAYNTEWSNTKLIKKEEKRKRQNGRVWVKLWMCRRLKFGVSVAFIFRK